MSFPTRLAILNGVLTKKFHSSAVVLTKDNISVPSDKLYKEGVDDGLTHTGQKFEKGDIRLARFMNSSKIVNPNFAIDLIAQVPPIPAKERVIWCDGGDGPIGHPRVYINLDKPGNHSCGYCGLRFVKENQKH